MQGTAISLSPPHSFPKRSLPFSRTRIPLSHPNVVFPSRSCSLSFSSPSSSSSYSSSSWPLQLRRPWNSVALIGPKKDVFQVRAAFLTESAGQEGKAGSVTKTLELGVLFGLWYLFNIYFNIYDKQVLKVYHYPWTITTIHFAIGSVLVLLMWITNLYKRPKISTSQLLAILPLAVAHTLGTLFLNMSLGKVAVSFTHTIKALEPIFTVALSAMFHREFPTPLVVASLFPIVGGVALASATELSFNWAGFWSAMASNLTNQSRNVLSKKIMVKQEESLDNITLFSIITIMSFILQFPATCYLEGFKFTPAYFSMAAQQGMDVKLVLIKSLLAGLCFHAYQQVAYVILERVSPVTHSVGNCVKRVVVIASSVLFFRTPVTFINSIGTGIALVGIFLYSRVKRIKVKPQAS